MGNLKSEQLTIELQKEIAFDDKLSVKEMVLKFRKLLGESNCEYKLIEDKKVLVYTSEISGMNEVLLFANITYLGGNGQHPIYKKRVQLKSWYKTVYEAVNNKEGYRVRFIGVYHYKGNFVYVDFNPLTYVKKKMNNSAAHVYINDLYQAMINGVFEKIDKNGNKIITVSENELKRYLDGLSCKGDNLIEIFKEFNNEFDFDHFISARQAITEMYDNDFNKWTETEWAGWYLEYKFDEFLRKKGLENQVVYTSSTKKSEGEFDFDLLFKNEDFQGDLKSSDIKTKEAPGNKKENVEGTIAENGRLWYIIYEHDTVKDKTREFEATIFRNSFIKKNEPKKFKSELSYKNRMKHSVKYQRMSIIELNEINKDDVLKEFTQGKQQDGKSREPKFSINKRYIDNVTIYRYKKD